MCHIDKNRARDACTKGLEGLTSASCDRNENLGGERDTRSAQAVLRDALRLICVLQGEQDRSLFLTCYIYAILWRKETNICFASKGSSGQILECIALAKMEYKM